MKFSEVEQKEKHLNSKFTGVNEDLAWKKIINCTKAESKGNIGKYLYKSRCKWENTIRNLDLRNDEAWDQTRRGTIIIRNSIQVTSINGK